MGKFRQPVRELHSEADRFEPRLARALVRASKILRDRTPIVDLANALAEGDVRAAEAVLTRVGFEDALVPSGAIVKDAFARGGRVGAEILDRMVRRG